MPVWRDDNRGCGRGGTSTLVSGLVVAGIGVLLLLNQLDVVNGDVLWRFWPMVFVVGGVVRLLETHSTGDQAFGAVLISIGALVTLHNFGFIRWGIGQLWPLFIIAAGLLLAWHSNEVREGRGGVNIPIPNIGVSGLQTFAFFGGIERKVEGKGFSGGNITALFGGFKIDLSRADLDADDTVLMVNAIFGGGEIIAPESWRVLVEGAGIFGAFVDKTRYVPRPELPTKTLHIRGAAIFGGVEVKSW